MNEKPELMINVFGGNVQIAPVATTATQILYGGRDTEVAIQPEDSERMECTEEQTEAECHLSLYVPDKKRLKNYVKLLGECTHAHEIATVVEEMMTNEERLYKEVVVKASFIELLQPFASRVTSGNTVDNIRQQINNLLADRIRKKDREKCE